MPEEGKDMVEGRKGSGSIQTEKGGEPQSGVIKPWGDPAFREPDLKPEEGRRLYRQDPAVKESQKRRKPKEKPPLPQDHYLVKRKGTIAEYINHRQD